MSTTILPPTDSDASLSVEHPYTIGKAQRAFYAEYNPETRECPFVAGWLACLNAIAEGYLTRQ